MSDSLSTAAFQILVALAEEPKHGYAVMKEVATATNGEVRLNPGTLYTTIRKLVEDDLIREEASPPEERDDRRRYYAATPLGRQAAQTELLRLQTLIARAAAKLA